MSSPASPTASNTLAGIRARKKEVKEELARVKAELEAVEAAKLASEARKKGLPCGGKQCKDRILLAYEGDFDRYRGDFVRLLYTTATQKGFPHPSTMTVKPGQPAPPTSRSSVPSTTRSDATTRR